MEKIDLGHIEPNYLNKEFKLSEEKLRKLIEISGDLGVSVLSLEAGKDEILEKIRENFPARYDLVIQKLKEEELDLDDLSKDLILDRMLGIDFMFSFKDKNYIVDVGTGKHSNIINKEKKFKEMEDLYREFGIDRALVLRLKEDITEDMALDLFGKLEKIDNEEDLFSIVVKYPETDMIKKKGRL